jgi:hypothetical protein
MYELLTGAIMRLPHVIQDAGFVDVPGEYTFWKTYGVPPERVALPLAVTARIGPLGWLLMLPLAIVMTVLGCLCFATLIGVDWTRRSLTEILIGLPALLFMIPLASLIVGTTVRLFADRCAKLPLAEIDQDGILDRRLAEQKIAWKQVEHANALYDRSGIAAISLRLISDAPAVALRRRFDLLRLRRRQPNEYFIEVKLLSVPQRRLALAILSLVRANGGKIGSNFPTEGDPLLARL